MDKPLPAYKGGDSYVFVCYSHTDQDVDTEIRRLHATNSESNHQLFTESFQSHVAQTLMAEQIES